jgi:hypothetical protein
MQEEHKIGDLLLSLDGCLGYIIDKASETTCWVEWIVPERNKLNITSSVQCLSNEFVQKLKDDLEKECSTIK